MLLVSDWSTLVVAKMSPWLQPDSTVDTVRRNSEEVSVAVDVTVYVVLYTLSDLLTVPSDAVIEVND